ncbi:TetR/AcrR family transcriptional regulator [Sphingomonas gellani]|nr:helix-turn-helix domain-containing protein [Sphingomonas gellani]
MAEPASWNARRLSSTESAIVEAFRTLAIERRYGAIRVVDIIDRAGVGKSTFYEHFKGKDDVLLTAMRPILLVLATAASGRAARSYVQPVVEHLWERRSFARPILHSTAASILQRRLADAIAMHGGRKIDTQGVPVFAVGIAAAQLAMLRCWLAGHVAATVDAMTDQLIACSRLNDGDLPS